MNLVEHYLAELDLHKILAIGPNPWAELEGYCARRQITLTFSPADAKPPSSDRFDLGIVYGVEQVPLSQLRGLLGELKNRLSERVWVLVSRDSKWQLTDFVALGFKKDAISKDCDFQSYSYNLETYNHKRDWNNPRFWANPENWHLRF